MRKLVDTALASNIVFLSKDDLSAVLLDKLMNDKELRDIFKNDNDNFYKAAEKKADEFIDRLEANKERIPGYSRLDVIGFCSEYKHPTFLKNIKEAVLRPAIEDMNTVLSAVDSDEKSFAQAKKIIAAPFSHEDELKEKSERLSVLRDELALEASQKSKQPKSRTFYFSIADQRKLAQKARNIGSKAIDNSKDAAQKPTVEEPT